MSKGLFPLFDRPLFRFTLAFFFWFAFWLFVWVLFSHVYILFLKATLVSLFNRDFFSWASGVSQQGVHLALQTNLSIQSVVEQGKQGVLVLTPDVNTMKYTYGWPLLMALLTISARKYLFLKYVGGTLFLVPFSSIGIALDWLWQLVFIGHVFADKIYLNDVLAVSYQFFVLVVPTFVPIVSVLILESDFFKGFVARSEAQNPS